MPDSSDELESYLASFSPEEREMSKRSMQASLEEFEQRCRERNARHLMNDAVRQIRFA